MKLKITAVVLTKNENKQITRCLDSVAFCDEIIVVDDFSAEDTFKKIEENKSVDKIFKKKLNSNFSEQRNFGMSKEKNEWILFLDADEEISKELQEEIITKFADFSKSEVGAVYLRRRDFFWGREILHGETQTVRNKGIVRLVRKDIGSWEGKVHEEFKIKNLKSKIKNLNSFINHYPHQTIKEFIESVNFYSTLKAKELHEKRKDTNISEIIFLPFCKFIFTYFLKLGLMDRAPGFVYSFFMSFHSFLVRAKLYQYSRIDKKNAT